MIRQWIIFVTLYWRSTYDIAQCTKTEFRLVGGQGPWEGRVEVFHNGEYGTVCDDEFGPKDAKVFCTMLGYRSSAYTASAAAENQRFGSGTGRIWLDNLNCTGSEKDVSECQSNAWGVTDCDHSEDVGVVCPRTHVRLEYGSTNTIGRVQLSIPSSTHGDSWHAVCADGWGKKEAAVVCRMLGHESQTGSPRAITVPYYFSTDKSDSPQLSNFTCRGDEMDIFLCAHTAAPSTCASGAVAGVSCTPTGPRRTKISLDQGSNPWNGFVQINHEGRTGYICSWKSSSSVYNANLASVVCSSLGFPNRTGVIPSYSTEEFPRRYSYHSYTRPRESWMNNVACLGDEIDIADCLSKNGLSYQTCQTGFKVVCPQPATPNITAVRLVGGRFPWEGRVEVKNWGQWGTVCHRHWTHNVATVVCRMLGLHSKHIYAVNSSSYGSGNTTSVLETYSCHGNEAGLNNCSLTPHQKSAQCDKTDTAGLKCVDYDVHDVIEVECNKHSWLVAINMTLLKALYPDATLDSISMGHIGGCHGNMYKDGLLFYHSLNDCYTSSRTEEYQTVYMNHLSYTGSDHHHVDNTIWKQHLECSVYHERPPTNKTVHNEPIDISFYSDLGYMHALPEGSIPTQLHGRVYVRVSPEHPTKKKMILKDCQIVETGAGTHVLIKDGCETNTSTHISLMSDTESRFSFTATWSQTSTHPEGHGRVTCDVKFCDLDDQRSDCYHGCRTPLKTPLIG